MKRGTTKSVTKQIIYILIFLMLCNFIMPTYSYAVETEDGGSLMEVFAQFLCMLPDVVLGFLQDMFVTPEPIRLEDGNYNVHYSIKYSPGIIFSGEVPALDINFINPGENKLKQVQQRKLLGMDTDPNTCVDKSILQIMDELGYNIASDTSNTSTAYDQEVLIKIKEYLDNEENWSQYKISDDIAINEDIYVLYCQPSAATARWKWFFEKENSEDPYNPEGWVSEEYCEYNGDICDQNDIYNSIKLYIENKYGNVSDEKNQIQEDIKSELQEAINGLEFGNVRELTFQNNEKNVTVYIERGGVQVNNADKYHIYLFVNNTVGEYKDTAGVLQPIIATWYNALRRIALVGLLSAIVYIGIRIVLTSTSAKDKAKYKKMLKDWLVALCLLFVLHYIMSITVTVVNKINEVVKASSIAANGEDILMTSVRNRILNLDCWGEALTYVIIYDVLTVFTIIYTIQYIKRIIYIAFLTMIAPLITLTYPLDKIKDNKSQAFDMWLKDYIFFSLIQVVHLLIYYIFLGTTINLANEGNWVFAVVAIGFIVPAEKLIKKMFGFEKSQNLGAMAAGATGALVMNAMQKIPTIGKGSSGTGGSANSGKGEDSGKVIRTAGANPFVNFGNETEGAGLPASSGSGSPSNGSTISSSPKSGESGSRPASGSTPTMSTSNSSSKKSRGNVWVKGTWAVTKKYGGKAFKGAMKGAAKGFVGATGAIIGFSAGVAQGDVSKAFSGMAIGATAGTKIAQKTGETAMRMVEKVPEKIDEVVDTYREGAYGKQVAQNAKFDKAFRSSKEYDELKRTAGIPQDEFDRKVQKMLDSGISDAKKMKKILKNNKKDPKRYSMDKSIMYSEMADKCSHDILLDNKKFIRFCELKKIDLSKEELNKLREDIINFK